MTKPKKYKTKQLYLAYDEMDDSWDVVWNPANLQGYSFYCIVKVPAVPARKPACIGEFEIEIVNEVPA